MRKLLLSALLVVFFVGIFYGQSSTQPTGVDLEHVTWVDGDVLVRFDDHVERPSPGHAALRQFARETLS